MNTQTMLTQIIILATQAHADQTDKAGVPYILHPLAVAQKLNSNDIELICIALGHDLIEDTAVTKDTLVQLGFSDRIITGIVALTKVDGETRDEKMTRIKSNSDAVLVKIADLAHNMDMGRFPDDYVPTLKDGQRTAEYMKMYRELVLFSSPSNSDQIAEYN
jgi:(p)ppGpp synthase/HD superfamily hydrolase